MHPVYNKVNFGVHGIQIKFYNGTSAVNGYIVRQIGQLKYIVTDGTSTNGVLNTWTCTLAQTSTQATSIGSSQPTIFAIPLSSPLAGASGATFTPTYSFDSANTSIISGGAGFSTADTLIIDGGVRPQGTITITTNPLASDTLTLNGTAITFVASGAVSPQVNIGGTNILTADALYTMLAASADTQLAKCWYYHVTGTNVITVISKTVGTANNSYTLAASSSRTTLSGSTLLGGLAAVAGTPTQVQVTQTGGVVTGFGTLTTAGAWTSLPTSGSTTYAYYAGNQRLPVALTAKFIVASIAASGGSGYATGDVLTFSGFTDLTAPQATLVASSGAASSVTVTTAGTGITVAGTIGVDGAVEYVKTLYDTQCMTVAGVKHFWSLGNSSNGSAAVPKFS